MEQNRWVYTLMNKLYTLSGKDSNFRMKRIFLAAVMMGAVALMASPADNTLGTWKYVPEKSNGRNIASLTQTRENVDGGVKVTVTGESADGHSINSVWVGKYDGKPVKIATSPFDWDTIAAKRIDANTVSEERTKAGGKFHSISRFHVSADGKTMTVTTKGTWETGEAFTMSVLWEKQ